MQNPKIKALIFDLGGVLVGFKQEAFVKETLSYVPSPGKLDWKQPEVIEAHRQFELGNLSKKQFYGRILPFMREKISFKEFSRIWGAGIFIWRPAVAEFIKKLRANGYKIGILSNCDAYSYPLIMSHYRLRRFVNAAAPSFKVHSRKPEKKLFMAVLKGLHEKPGRCIYIDDLQGYVKIAKKFGLHSIQFKGLSRLKKALSGLGVRAN